MSERDTKRKVQKRISGRVRKSKKMRDKAIDKGRRYKQKKLRQK